MTEIEDRWRDLGAFIREQRRVGQLSLRKLSEMAGISNPYLSQIERGLRHPSAEILRNIAGALSISAETLYVRAGILDERDGEHDLVEDIRRDPFIDEEQKKTLVHIYQSFRAAHLAAAGADAALVAAAGPAIEGGIADLDVIDAESDDHPDPDGGRPDGLDHEGLGPRTSTAAVPAGAGTDPSRDPAAGAPIGPDTGSDDEPAPTTGLEADDAEGPSPAA